MTGREAIELFRTPQPGITSSDLIRLSWRPGLLLCLCLLGGGAVSVRADDYAAAHNAGSKVRINPQAVRLPIVDAVDNRFVRLSTAQGVSQLKVDQIVQDDDGFMWFGTRYGLYRYDGYSFKVFVREDGNPNSLNGVVINALFKGRDGALWVACDQSLNKFDRTTETFTQYPVPYATHITEDTAGILWVPSRNGLYRLDPVSGQIQHYTSDPNDPSSLSGKYLSYCGEDRRGAFWISSIGHLDEFDRKTGKVTRHILIPETPDGFEFYEDRYGVFWIFRSSPNALATLDRETNTLTRYALPEREPTLTRISAMLEDQTGDLWMATHGLGLLKLDREFARFIDYTNISTDAESLPQNKVDALFVDRVGDIWAAPGRMGPAFLTSKPPPFRRLPKTPGSTIEPFIGALYEDREGILWIGTPEALNRVDRKIGRTTAYQTGGPAVGTDVVSICEDRSGYLWVGTYGRGLHRFDPRTGKFKTYRHNPGDPHSLSNDYVMGLLIDHKGTLWAATGDGLSRFDSATEHFTVYEPDPSGTAFYRTVIEDQEGKMWLGTESSGLRQFDPATGRLVIYEHNSKLPGSLSDNRVNFVHFDRSGTVWVATQNGLDRLDRQTGTFKAFTQRDGLPGNAVGCVLEDNSGNLWMSTNNGVARFKSEPKTFSNFSVADGLPGPNLTGWSACSQSPSGEMFFGGFNGGASFFPDKVVDSSDAPPMVLTDFRLSGNPVAIGGNSPLRRSIAYTRDLILPNQDHVFSIIFAALNYSSPAATRYRYRLENLERVWNEVGSEQRQATYTTLPAGTYTFRVQGATRSGPWSEPGVALRIEILPPWWSTRPFQAAIGVLLILVAWAGYRQRVHLVAQRFEARLAERTRIARELHDTLLQGFHGVMFSFQAARNMLPRRPEEAIDALDGALERANQALAEGRDAIHDLRSSTVVTDELAQAVTALGKEMSHEVASQDSAHGSARFHLVVEGPPRDLDPILRDEVYAIVREAVRNAFRHAQAHDIEVEIRYSASSFQLRIRDDGKGIDPGVVTQGRTGHYGVPGMRERARRIGGRLCLWTATGAGTEIELRIPGSIAYGTSPGRSVLRLFRKKVANS